MNYNYTACCWFPTSSNIVILPSQFWQIRFESCWLHCSNCRILVLLRYSLNVIIVNVIVIVINFYIVYLSLYWWLRFCIYILFYCLVKRKTNEKLKLKTQQWHYTFLGPILPYFWLHVSMYMYMYVVLPWIQNTMNPLLWSVIKKCCHGKCIMAWSWLTGKSYKWIRILDLYRLYMYIVHVQWRKHWNDDCMKNKNVHVVWTWGKSNSKLDKSQWKKPLDNGLPMLWIRSDISLLSPFLLSPPILKLIVHILWQALLVLHATHAQKLLSSSSSSLLLLHVYMYLQYITVNSAAKSKFYNLKQIITQIPLFLIF